MKAMPKTPSRETVAAYWTGHDTSAIQLEEIYPIIQKMMEGSPVARVDPVGGQDLFLQSAPADGFESYYHSLEGESEWRC
jgi:hypothetical protein